MQYLKIVIRDPPQNKRIENANVSGDVKDNKTQEEKTG
jgi:hypothetical protein